MSRAAPAGTAPVVMQLLAFLREPAHCRPRFTVGRESLEGGHHVLRFAQGKIPPGVLGQTPTCTRTELKEAAAAFIRQVCLWDGATHYQLLCVSPDATRESIKENYHLLMALIHPDRRDKHEAPWPADCAQRANLAYGILGDDAKRRHYDASLAKAKEPRNTNPPFVRARPRAAPRARALRWQGLVMRAVVAFTAVAATLVMFAMWRGDVARDTALVREWAGKRSRELLAAAERPRYLAPSLGPAQGIEASPEEKAPVEPPILTPLVRRLKPEVEMATPVAPERARQVEAVAEPRLALASSEIAQAPAKVEAPPAASTSVEASAIPKKLSTQDIEIVVARLIGYYEAGEVDKLMGLVDSSKASPPESARIRQLYSEFFRATRQRTLRVSSIDWQSSADSAHARGDALLEAEYFGDARLERKVSLELDIGLRDGRAMITHLSLFPAASPGRE